MGQSLPIELVKHLEMVQCDCLIVGGGIAGVTCAENLKFLAPSTNIILLTESSLIKAVSNLVQLGKCLQKFDVTETSSNSCNFQVIHERLVRIESQQKVAITDKSSISYQFLVLCTGARPKLIPQAENCSKVIGIRDTDTALDFQTKLKGASRVIVVGNGGIASEIVHEVKGVSIDWVVKDDHIASTFVDAGAAKFFLDSEKTPETTTVKRMRYDLDDSKKTKGAALGPDWHRWLDIRFGESAERKIHYNCEIIEVFPSGNKLMAILTDKTQIQCDFIVSATGVNPQPDFAFDIEPKLGPDGAIFVDELMQTSLPSIYAAGDCCFAGWQHAPQWFQMRLWTQARQMGAMVAKSISGKIQHEMVLQDFCFELFGHVTQLFGFQVVLLGKYNGQGLNDQYEMLVRVIPGQEYVKFVLKEGKLQGAILVGETGLEETCENLVLNQLDLTPFGEDILNPDIDIEDYFD